METNENKNPFEELQHMNIVSRVFFWASFDRATGSEEPYIVLLWNNLLMVLKHYLLVFLIILAFAFIGMFYGKLTEKSDKAELQEQQRIEKIENDKHWAEMEKLGYKN